jgi:hypothetical protein
VIDTAQATALLKGPESSILIDARSPTASSARRLAPAVGHHEIHPERRFPMVPILVGNVRVEEDCVPGREAMAVPRDHHLERSVDHDEVLFRSGRVRVRLLH